MNNRLTILGKQYQVKMVDTEEYNGKINVNKATIWIRRDLSKQQQEDTLLHEVIHAISSELSLDLTERQVRVLATTLYAQGLKIPYNFGR